MINRSHITTNIRLAGQVLRYHTWPTHHHQTVGEHTWNCMCIWWEIFGPLPPEVSTYLLWHDAGEIAIGDPPFPVKANNPTLKSILDELEGEAVTRMGGPQDLELTPQDRRRAKICDLLEMYGFGLHEMLLGNRYAEPIVHDTLEAVGRLQGELYGGDADLVQAYVYKLRERFVNIAPPMEF